MSNPLKIVAKYLLAPIALLGHPFRPGRLRPWLAGTLSLLCPGLGHWYLGQGGLFAFYLSWVLLSGVGAYALLLDWWWRRDSDYAGRFLVWGAFSIGVGAAWWLLSAVDAWLRTRRELRDPWQPPPSRPWTAAFLSLLIPGTGQIFSRRFLVGIWYLVLIGGLAAGGWEEMPRHGPEYYARFTSDSLSWNYAYHLGLAWAYIWTVGVLWIANVFDAGFHAGQQDVLPLAITRHITPGRMREAWPEFVYALGFLSIEVHALDTWWPESTWLLEYLKYWLLFECLTAIGVIVGITLFRRQQFSGEARAALYTLCFLAIATGFVLFATDRFNPGWLAAAFAVVTVPRLLHIAAGRPDVPALLDKLRLAAGALVCAVMLLGFSFLFWRGINPWFFDHLADTRGLYSLGFFFYFVLGWLELRKTGPDPSKESI